MRSDERKLTVTEPRPPPNWTVFDDEFEAGNLEIVGWNWEVRWEEEDEDEDEEEEEEDDDDEDEEDEVEEDEEDEETASVAELLDGLRRNSMRYSTGLLAMGISIAADLGLSPSAVPLVPPLTADCGLDVAEEAELLASLLLRYWDNDW